EVNVFQGTDCLQFNHDQIFYNKIEAVFTDLMVLVEKRDRSLPNESYSLERKLYCERLFINRLKKSRSKRTMNRDRSTNDPLCHGAAAQIFSCFPAFLIHTVPGVPAFSQPGSWASDTMGISSSAISSSGVYSGGRGGGTGFCARWANSSGNFSRRLCVGQAQASPKAQMVRPAMLSATFLSVAGSCVTPPPDNIRSVIFFIQSQPSR